MSFKSHVVCITYKIYLGNHNSNCLVNIRITNISVESLVGSSCLSSADTESILCPGCSKPGGSNCSTQDTPTLQPVNQKLSLLCPSGST